MEKLISFEEAQQLTGIKIATWRSWAAQRRIATVRLGRRIKLRVSDLERFVEANTVPARPEHSR